MRQSGTPKKSYGLPGEECCSSGPQSGFFGLTRKTALSGLYPAREFLSYFAGLSWQGPPAEEGAGASFHTIAPVPG